MSNGESLNSICAEVEDTLKQRDAKIEELKAELDDAHELVKQQNEQVENGNQLIEDWIEAFGLELNDKGEYGWGDGLVKWYAELGAKYQKLRKDSNQFVPLYNNAVAPRRRNVGRPLQASEAQQVDVLSRRKKGPSLRDIADFTNLSLNTVRTIVDKKDSVDRATMARLQRRLRP